MENRAAGANYFVDSEPYDGSLAQEVPMFRDREDAARKLAVVGMAGDVRLVDLQDLGVNAAHLFGEHVGQVLDDLERL